MSNVTKSIIKVKAVNDACLSSTKNRFEIRTLTFSAEREVKNDDVDVSYLFDHVYKDYKNNLLYSNERRYFDCYVKEPLPAIEWKLTGDRKEILGYNCNEASGHFRGREYTAWFTTELPFKAAPWKFYGLPGVMLEVKSKDNFVSMEAIELKVTDGKYPQNPLEGKEFMTWDDYAVLFAKRVKKNQENLDASQARMGLPTAKINLPRIEIIIDENRLDEIGNKYWNNQSTVLKVNQKKK
jgi:GLPGLI family protein